MSWIITKRQSIASAILLVVRGWNVKWCFDYGAFPGEQRTIGPSQYGIKHIWKHVLKSGRSMDLLRVTGLRFFLSSISIALTSIQFLILKDTPQPPGRALLFILLREPTFSNLYVFAYALSPFWNPFLFSFTSPKLNWLFFLHQESAQHSLLRKFPWESQTRWGSLLMACRPVLHNCHTGNNGHISIVPVSVLSFMQGHSSLYNTCSIDIVQWMTESAHKSKNEWPLCQKVRKTVFLITNINWEFSAQLKVPTGFMQARAIA